MKDEGREREEEERQPAGWRCAGCGEKFYRDPGSSHAVHARDCDGVCRTCPVECGPIYAEGR